MSIFDPLLREQVRHEQAERQSILDDHTFVAGLVLGTPAWKLQQRFSGMIAPVDAGGDAFVVRFGGTDIAMVSRKGFSFFAGIDERAQVEVLRVISGILNPLPTPPASAAEAFVAYFKAAPR